jgi:hypothetical protein
LWALGSLEGATVGKIGSVIVGVFVIQDADMITSLLDAQIIKFIILNPHERYITLFKLSELQHNIFLFIPILTVHKNNLTGEIT